MSNVNDINNVHISGERQKAFLKHVGVDGKAICNFNIKCVSGPRTHYLPCKAWEAVAVQVDQMREGDFIEVQGRLEIESWDDKATGKKVYKTVVNVTKIVSPAGEKQTARRVQPEEAAIPDDDVPF